MTACDVVVIGAGPAGSTCAAALQRAGLEVILLDGRPFPREKPCAGWITPEVLETLAVAPEEYRRWGVLEELREFAVSLVGGPETVTRYDRPVSYAVRRSDFDYYLLERSGVRRVLGEPVKRLDRCEGEWIVNGIRAPLVVGAGGHSCPVARLLGARVGVEEAVVAQAAEVVTEDAAAVPQGRGELFFSRDLKGYGWALRKGDYLNVGFGRLDRRDFGRHLAEFRHLLERRGIEVPAVDYRGHAYLVYRRAGGRRIVGDRLLLVGDAAGLAYPHSGEGILPAVESALLAAQTIVEAAGDYRSCRLEPYRRRLARRFGGGWGALPSLPVPAGLVPPVASALFSSSLCVRRIVLDRLFLHRDRKVLSLDAAAPSGALSPSP